MTDKEYWRLKNRIGYALLRGDKGEQTRLEKEMEQLKKK